MNIQIQYQVKPLNPADRTGIDHSRDLPHRLNRCSQEIRSDDSINRHKHCKADFFAAGTDWICSDYQSVTM